MVVHVLFICFKHILSHLIFTLAFVETIIISVLHTRKLKFMNTVPVVLGYIACIHMGKGSDQI